MCFNVYKFYLVFICSLILNEWLVYSLKCYTQMCSCVDEDDGKWDQLKNLNKQNCGCRHEGLGKVSDCDFERPTCVDVTYFNTTGQTRFKTCGKKGEDGDSGKALRCKKFSGQTNEEVECTCEEDLCNIAFTNVFKQYQELDVFRNRIEAS